MNIEISDRLVALRREHHFSQEDLAAKLGVSRQAISKWERAESSPDTDNLIALAQLYGISLDTLLLDGGMAFQFQTDPEEQEDGDEVPDTQSQEEPEHSNFYDYNPSLYEQQLEWEAQERDRRKNALRRFPFTKAITLIYLAGGFLFSWWHPGWMLYLLVPIYYWLVSER